MSGFFDEVKSQGGQVITKDDWNIIHFPTATFVQINETIPSLTTIFAPRRMVVHGEIEPQVCFKCDGNVYRSDLEIEIQNGALERVQIDTFERVKITSKQPVVLKDAGFQSIRHLTFGDGVLCSNRTWFECVNAVNMHIETINTVRAGYTFDVGELRGHELMYTHNISAVYHVTFTELKRVDDWFCFGQNFGTLMFLTDVTFGENVRFFNNNFVSANLTKTLPDKIAFNNTGMVYLQGVEQFNHPNVKFANFGRCMINPNVDQINVVSGHTFTPRRLHVYKAAVIDECVIDGLNIYTVLNDLHTETRDIGYYIGEIAEDFFISASDIQSGIVNYHNTKARILEHRDWGLVKELDEYLDSPTVTSFILSRLSGACMSGIDNAIKEKNIQHPIHIGAALKYAYGPYGAALLAHFPDEMREALIADFETENPQLG